jgi:ribonuclease P protein component
MTIFLVENGGQPPRFGVAATRRIGNAVARNRAKRLAREVFRRHRPTAGLDVVIVPRAEIFNAGFNHIEADFIAALTRPGGTRTSARAARPRGNGRGGRH